MSTTASTASITLGGGGVAASPRGRRQRDEVPEHQRPAVYATPGFNSAVAGAQHSPHGSQQGAPQVIGHVSNAGTPQSPAGGQSATPWRQQARGSPAGQQHSNPTGQPYSSPAGPSHSSPAGPSHSSPAGPPPSSPAGRPPGQTHRAAAAAVNAARMAEKSAYSGGGGLGQMGTVYKAKPQTQQPQPFVPNQPIQQAKPAPQPYIPGPQYNGPPSTQTQYQAQPQQQPRPDIDLQRQEEARKKMVEMNLSEQALNIYKKRFDILDLNKDGVVNLREFAAISRVLGYKFTKEEVQEIFGRRDLDDSGSISFEEFVIAMAERQAKNKEYAPYREKFREYDWKGTGYVTSDEAAPVLKRELGFDENKTEMLIDSFDRNRDYRLSLLEFIDFYKKVQELKTLVMNAFRSFDKNGDGFVSFAEMCAMLTPKGFTDDQVHSIIIKHDKDGDGQLNYPEFAAFWDIPIDQ